MNLFDGVLKSLFLELKTNLGGLQEIRNLDSKLT